MPKTNDYRDLLKTIRNHELSIETFDDLHEALRSESHIRLSDDRATVRRMLTRLSDKDYVAFVPKGEEIEVLELTDKGTEFVFRVV